MKRMIFEGVLALSLIFGLGAYASRAVADMKKEVSQYADTAQTQVQQLRMTLNEALAMVQETLPKLETSGAAAEATDETTRLVSIVYDNKGGYLYETDEKLPSYLVNLNREQITNFYEAIYGDFSETDGETAIEKAQLISFSPEMVVVKKFCEKPDRSFFITAKDGTVVVYYEDKETLYEDTDIPVDQLSPEEQEQLAEGICAENAEELFSILESYTS